MLVQAILQVKYCQQMQSTPQVARVTAHLLVVKLVV